MVLEATRSRADLLATESIATRANVLRHGSSRLGRLVAGIDRQVSIMRLGARPRISEKDEGEEGDKGEEGEKGEEKKAAPEADVTA